VTGDAIGGNEIAGGGGSRFRVPSSWVLVPGSEFYVLGSEFCVQ
jgi:hypothetical protein